MQFQITSNKHQINQADIAETLPFISFREQFKPVQFNVKYALGCYRL